MRYCSFCGAEITSLNQIVIDGGAHGCSKCEDRLKKKLKLIRHPRYSSGNGIFPCQGIKLDDLVKLTPRF